MSKEELLISLLKSEQSIHELRKSNNNVEIKEIKEKFNALRNKFSEEKIKEIRKKFYKKEKINHRLKEPEQKDSLTKQEEREKKHLGKEFKKVEEFLKKTEENINILEKHRYHDMMI